MTHDAPAPETPAAPPAPARRMNGAVAGYVALGVSVVALGLAAAPYLGGGSSDVRAYLLEHPEVLQEASLALQAKEGQARVDETNQAAAANAALLAPDRRDPAFGPANAKVTVMTERALTPETIDRILVEHGVDLARAKATLAAPDTTRHIADIHTTAAALKLQGTPTFFVNGKAAASIDPAEIARMIEAAKR